MKLIATNAIDNSTLLYDEGKERYIVAFDTDEGDTKETVYGRRETAMEAFFHYTLP